MNFRDIMSLVPTSVSVISCREESSIYGCTISSLVSVNVQEESPEIVFVLKKQSLVGEKIKAHNFFTINVLSASQDEIAQKYSADRSPENISDHGWIIEGDFAEIPKCRITMNCKVVSFEPSFLNLELLFRNVQTNNLQDKITIVPLSLSNKNQIENFYMQEGDNIWGGAHNSSGSNKSQDGTEMLNFKVSSQLALSLDSLVEFFSLPNPRFLYLSLNYSSISMQHKTSWWMCVFKAKHFPGFCYS